MNTARSVEQLTGKRRSRRRKTSHLKKVPQSRQVREQVKTMCAEFVSTLDKSRPLAKDEMEKIARGILEKADQPEGYLGWAMVLLASAFWKDQVAAVPHSRRLFLLPHCLKHAQGCPADYDQFGLDCKTCGACSIADFRSTAEDMGYKVLVAEGSPIVLKIIVSGYVDAIVGVACLNVLEKAIDKILLAGIPCMAVPLLSSDCRNTSVDEDWVSEMIHVDHRPTKNQTRSYVHLMRAATNIFENDTLQRLAPRIRDQKQLSETNGQGVFGFSPIAATEAISYDFLAKGGKYSRPFITLAVYDAMTGGKATMGDGQSTVEEFPDHILRTAMSIETFHKASLVHDDIEDDDQYRYGDESIHRKYGISTGINVGDYLVGLGYRLISRGANELGPEKTNDIIDCLADAHIRLSEGQGAELIWRDALDKQLKPIDALKIYALKTAPAFEAALFSGLRLAGEIDDYVKPVKQFARNVGVAFQILNDLSDWREQDHNKVTAGGDILGGRPTLLLALALESLDEAGRANLLKLIGDESVPAETRIAQVRTIYFENQVFEKAEKLVAKHQHKAEEVADNIEPEELRRLLYYLIDSVLDRQESVEPTIHFIEPTEIGQVLPGIS